jgi:hypothetical protein
MNLRALVVVCLMAGGVAFASAQSPTATEMTPIIITGEVVRYEPGRLLVVRSANKEVTYELSPRIQMPAELQVGRTVSVYTERGSDGVTTVTRVTTTTVTPGGRTKRTTEETRLKPTGETSRMAVTVSGDVVGYAPGRTIVLRQADGNDMSFNLAPNVVVPAEVQTGRRVTLHMEPGPDGSTLVRRVTTTSVTPEGQMKRTVEETRTAPSGATSRSQVTTISGQVVQYVPGRTLVLRQAEGADVTFALDPRVVIPADVQIGRQVTVEAEPGSDRSKVISRVTTTSVTPEGQMKRTVEETRTSPMGETTKTTLVTIQGTVESYTPGKAITVVRSDGTRATYLIGQGARLPDDIAPGKAVVIQTVPVVETIILDKN